MANRHYHLKYHITNDAEIIARLDAQESIQGYIRRLIQSDILADMLRPAFHLEDRTLTYDEWMEKNCPAFDAGSVDYDCRKCPYSGINPDDGHIECCADYYYEAYVEDKKAEQSLAQQKHDMNSLYGRMLKDPLMDDVIDNMLEEKSNGEQLQEP